MIASLTAQAVRRTGETLATQPAESEHRPSSPAATIEWPLSFLRYRRIASADFHCRAADDRRKPSALSVTGLAIKAVQD